MLFRSLADAITRALPEGIAVTGVAALADRAPALQEAVGLVEWEIELTTTGDAALASPEVVHQRVERLLAAPTLVVERVRKGRTGSEDIRPAIRRITVLGPTEQGTLMGVELATRPTSVRPAELVAALGTEFREGRVRRTRQWIERGDERCEPLGADPRIALEARAS